MAWTIFKGPFAITTQRRIVASALIYGLTLTIRLTSSAGEEVRQPPPAAPSTSPPRAIMNHDGLRSFNNQSFTSVRTVLFQPRARASRVCHAECESPIQLASLPDCSAP